MPELPWSFYGVRLPLYDRSRSLNGHWDRNRNRKLQTSKTPLKSQAQGTILFTSAALNQRGFPKNSPWEAQVRLPDGERMLQIRGVFQRIVRGCSGPKARGGRLGVKAGVV